MMSTPSISVLIIFIVVIVLYSIRIVMNYMSHTDHAEDTNEKPNSALLLFLNEH